MPGVKVNLSESPLSSLTAGLSVPKTHSLVSFSCSEHSRQENQAKALVLAGEGHNGNRIHPVHLATSVAVWNLLWSPTGVSGLKSRAFAHADLSPQCSSYWQALLQLSCFCSVFRPVCRWRLQGRFHSYPRLRARSLLLFKIPRCTLFISPFSPALNFPSFTCPYSFLAPHKENKTKSNPFWGIWLEKPFRLLVENLRNTFLLLWMKQLKKACQVPNQGAGDGAQAVTAWYMKTPLPSQMMDGKSEGQAAPAPRSHTTLTAAELHHCPRCRNQPFINL